MVAECPSPVATWAPAIGEPVEASVTVPATVPWGPVDRAETPFGVPSPVGPSQPGPAWHSTLPHPPLAPAVTSKRSPGSAYG